MADQTADAVAKLLGVLATAIKDETALLGALPRNMQFIKDELDSMNGFLLHLTKTETAHDDQVRAWMKQVRDVAYVGEDCVDRYVRDIVPHEPAGPLNGCCGGLPFAADLRFLLCHPKKYCLRRRLAKQILELRVRVNDVGERRLRYGVTVPQLTPNLADKTTVTTKAADAQEESSRDAFRRALVLQQQADDTPSPPPSDDADLPSYIKFAISKLPDRDDATVLLVRGVWNRCRPSPPPPPGEDDDDKKLVRCIEIEMLLCALYPSKLDNNLVELKRLKTKLEERARPEEIQRQVMVFCYSLLTTSQKSCLQYLTVFLEETAISRTSLVRRWVAEGFVGKEQGRTPEEVGERYFNELVFRGFVHPARVSDSGTIKSCQPLTGPIRTFVTDIAGRENFVDELPVHLDRQLRIRKIVHRKTTTSEPPQPTQGQHICSCWRTTRRNDAAGRAEPMDELVAFLGELSEMYRLNVLDLGGCRGLKQRHIKAICTVTCLKYLCLRNTDVSRLKPRLLNRRLAMLETLDIRETKIQPGDIKRIFLPKLKHLLAGSYSTSASDEVVLDTVEMPVKIGEMKNMETLSQVQVSSDDDGAQQLAGVARLRKLRKLGVVVDGNDRTALQLHGVILAMAGCLRSLSVWVTKKGGALDISIQEEATPVLILENLDITGTCKLPSWIEKATKLANITLRDTELSGDETLRRLGNVPSLSCLTLDSRSFVGQVLSFKDVRFKALRFLIVDGDTAARVAFEADAAPKLEKIVCNIGSRVHGGGELIIVGIQHLQELQVIELRGNFSLTKLKELKQGATTATNPRYHCRYLDRSGETQFVEIPKTDTDTTFSLPVGIIDQQTVV